MCRTEGLQKKSRSGGCARHRLGKVQGGCETHRLDRMCKSTGCRERHEEAREAWGRYVEILYIQGMCLTQLFS